MQELVELRRLDAPNGFLLIDQAFVAHVDGDPHRRLRGALAVAGLQHEQLTLLDGELDVLHVVVVLLEPVAEGDELVIERRQHFLHRRQIHAHRLLLGQRQRLRRANAGDDVFALRVDQVFAVEQVFAGRRVAREATPVAESSPMLPNTIACTLTAVPQSSGMLFSLR